ncbi:MAG: hypothetical protein Q9208_001763 [Pyrenodesmia sp. 3 TL-2023]
MEQQCQKLRSELKEWEKAFATANGGKKAGREDIKQHPDIANKYKLYNKLRAAEAAVLDQTIVPAKEQSSKKRHAAKPPPVSAQTPQKRSKHTHSPPQDMIAIPHQPPDSPRGTPVAHRKSIGPTPQKNGRVLGLFDLLTPSSSFRTPSKRHSLGPLPTNVAGTPSGAKAKADGYQAVEPIRSTTRRSRSPPSASKRTYLASFLTPSTRRIADISGTPEATNSVSKLRFDETPAFLRRDSRRFWQSQRTGVGNNGDEESALSWSPVAVRTMRPKPAGRGLSALVKGLREMEEAKLDEELDMLREMEGEEETAQTNRATGEVRVCVEDSQVPDMPLGPDGQGDGESEDLEALEAEGKDRNGRPLRVWKKKGQKRTTRRVTIKPNTAKWKPEPEWKGGKEQESEEDVAAVEETQLAPTAPVVEPDEDVEGRKTDDDYISEGASDEGEPDDQRMGKGAKQTRKEKEAQKEPPKERGKKKTSATAHANFRALKIKNKNSKAKGRGRFGRRR